jgi:bis(5'-nucleosyl)-tetraphosphatase (symmetrical)
MARYAIGDVQGCDAELARLLAAVRFNADRDELWFVGDLVNRGPDSLGVLRRVRALDPNAIVVLGNHDLHLLAVALCAGARKRKAGDTLDAVLAAPDRDALLEWLLARPLAHLPAGGRDLLIHAGIVPQWSPDQTVRLAHEVEQRLRREPEEVFASMYGNRPDQWEDSLTGADRTRFVINALTRLRFCTRDGRVDLKLKGAPAEAPADFAPWFTHRDARRDSVRIVFGHWSTLGLVQRRELLALDTGCVWGGALTAVDLDDPERPPWQIACAGYQEPGAEA